MSSSSTAAFDDLAAGYDQSFTTSAVGQLQRAAVWRRLDATFQPGDRVLEIGSGTGEDARHLAQRGVHVLGIEPAAAMVGVAGRKLEQAGMAGQARIIQGAAEDLGAIDLGGATGSFDGALSNFGALNCVADLEAFARQLAGHVRPGGRALLCLMGPWVPWEWLWFLRRGQPRVALRRLRRDGVVWRGLTVRYPSVGRLRRWVAADWRPLRVTAIGALVPPSYAEAWAVRNPRLLARLNRWERRHETSALLVRLADHFLLELERR